MEEVGRLHDELARGAPVLERLIADGLAGRFPAEEVDIRDWKEMLKRAQDLQLKLRKRLNQRAARMPANCEHLEQVFGGKRTNLEAQAAQKTQDTKNALFGVRRFQRFLLQKRSGDEAVTSLVTSVFWTKFGCFGAFLAKIRKRIG